MTPFNQKGKMPSKWAPKGKKGGNAIKICLSGPYKYKSKRDKMPSKSAYMDPISQKGTKCHQNMPQWASSVKKGEMPSKSALIGPISEKGAKCHQNMPQWAS